MAHLFIDGQWVSPQVAASADIRNPFDQSVLATVDEAGPADATRAVAAARAAFDSSPWPATPVRERAALLDRIAGRELGPTGLAEYQEIKHIWHNTAPAPAGWFNR